MKKYQIYQLNKIKIIGGDLFFIKNKGLYSSRNNIKKAKSKTNDLLDAHQINKTNYKFSPSMKIGEGAYCKVFYGIDEGFVRELADNGRKPILTEDDLNRYMDLAERFWSIQEDIFNANTKQA